MVLHYNIGEAAGRNDVHHSVFVQDIRHDNTVRLRKHWPLLPHLISANQPHNGGQRGNEGVLRRQDLRDSGQFNLPAPVLIRAPSESVNGKLLLVFDDKYSVSMTPGF